MVDSLDKRTKRQRQLVLRILQKMSWTEEQLLALSVTQVNDLENETLKLCYHLLRDLEYLDSLR